MSHQSGAVRQPANDLIAFDISKRSPEQIALLFARWKEQRKRMQDTQAPADAAKSTGPRFMPVVVGHPKVDAAAPAASAETTSEPRPIRYSAPFVAILSAAGDNSTSLRIKDLNLAPARQRAPRRAMRRSRLWWALAGAASVIAVAAVSGATLWQIPWRQSPPAVGAAAVSLGANPAQAEPSATQARDQPLEIQTAARLIPLATQAPAATAWPLQQIVDIALIQPVRPVAEARQVGLNPKLKPRSAAVRTASKPVVPRQLAPIVPSEWNITPDIATSAQTVPAEDIAPSAVGAAVPPEAEKVATSSPRPTSFSQRGNDKADYDVKSGSRASVSRSQSPDVTGGSAGPGGSGGTGAGDPGSGTGGSGGDSGTGSGGGDTGGGSAGGGSGGGSDTGSGGSGGAGDGSGGGGNSGGSGDSGSGGGNTGGGDTSGAGGGLGGAIGGATGGIGDAVGGAVGGLGGGQGTSDKGKDKGKDKNKSN